VRRRRSAAVGYAVLVAAVAPAGCVPDGRAGSPAESPLRRPVVVPGAGEYPGRARRPGRTPARGPHALSAGSTTPSGAS
jgi:hypothetical protein